MYKAKSDLERLLFEEIEKNTPNEIKTYPLIDLNQEDSFSFILKKEHLLKNTSDPSPLNQNEKRHPDGLGLYYWFENYRKEALISTAGIRGPQNPLYPWDTRYPINFIGVMLATLGKTLVAREHFPDSQLYKIAASEVRYNSKAYIDIIARLQAAYGIETLVLPDDEIIPIWLTSFLIFSFDLYGGEYVTASHAISKKIATKDLNYQGSQYIPETSILFVKKIAEIFEIVEKVGSYEIRFAAKNDLKINSNYLPKIEYGIPLYLDYLKRGIATKENIDLIKDSHQKIVIDCEGGSIAPTLSKILDKLGIADNFTYIHHTPDPFFHEIGKSITSSNKFNDFGCDATIMNFDEETVALPVVDTMKYQKLLADYPVKTKVLIADPDGDRLVTCEIEPTTNIEKLKRLGIAYYPLDNDRVLALYTPNQSFLITLDFHADALKRAKLWDKYDWFMIKTTASARSWDEWGKANNIPVFNTPVGFKEIATAMQKVENLMTNRTNPIITQDVFGKDLNLGKNPRLLFAGEESGGEIFAPIELIQSKLGVKAISMREKSAGEAIIITAALAAHTTNHNQYLSDYLEMVFSKNNIQAPFDIRVDIKYYNENESDITKLMADKTNGIKLRTQNDLYFRSIALMMHTKQLTIENTRAILSEGLPQLDFTDLNKVNFVGDGTFLEFADKYVEVRPSGTDAINKAYASAKSHNECVKYAQALGSFSGERNALHVKLIPNDFYNQVPQLSLKLLSEYQQQDLPINTYSPRPELD